MNCLPRPLEPYDYFNEALPAVAEGCASHPFVRRFDAVIVDEGQDFKDVWWLVLEALLKPDGPRVLRVFADNNQRVYGNTSRLTKDLQVAPIALCWNLRNTQSIHEAAYRYYQGASVRCEGPAGEPPRLVEATDRSTIVNEVVRLTQSLTAENALGADEIAILVPNEGWRTDIAREVCVRRIKCTDAPRSRDRIADC